MIKHILTILFLVCFIPFLAFSQKKENEGIAITFETMYDDPGSINKLWIGLQPVYADMFTSNVNLGFGGQATYIHGYKLTANFQARKAYSQRFDLNRHLASTGQNKMIDGQKLKPEVFNYFEGGATYHLRDRVEEGTAKMVLITRKRANTNVPGYIVVESQVRKIYGARLGGTWYDSSLDLNKALFKQKKTLANQNDEPLILPPGYELFGNIYAGGFYMGGSMSIIRNIAIRPDKNYPVLVNDGIFTAYFDVLVSPYVKISDVRINNDIYSASDIKTNKLGFRIGIDGLFNREFSWGYGAEIGMRPGVKSGGLFAIVKMSFPVWATNLTRQKEAFGR